jgi:GT2 family glycosyltransferase
VCADTDDHRLLAVCYHSFQCKESLEVIDTTRACYIAGFYPREMDGIWSAGRRSIVILPDAHRARDVNRLQLELSAFRAAFRTYRVDILTSQGLFGYARVGRKKLHNIALRRPWFRKSTRLVVGDFSAIRTSENVSQQNTQPVVSIIITNHDRSCLTRLSAIAAASSRVNVPFEILCADNGSSAAELGILSRAEVPMRVLELGSNRGFGEACNTAAKEARGEYLLFLNNDAFLRPGTVDELLCAFAAHPDCGAAGPVMLNIDDSLQEAGCSIQPDGFPIRHGREEPGFNLKSLPRFKTVDYVSAACLMVKRDEFLAMGGFAPKYSPAYYEDTDFCLRLLLRGKRVYLASKTSCYHIENATSRDIENGAWATRTSEAHRAIFLKDWAPYLASRNPADFPKL